MNEINEIDPDILIGANLLINMNKRKPWDYNSSYNNIKYIWNDLHILYTILDQILELESELISKIEADPKSVSRNYIKSIINIFQNIGPLQIDHNNTENQKDLIKYTSNIFKIYKDFNKTLIDEKITYGEKIIFDCQDFIDNNRLNMTEKELIDECNKLKRSYDALTSFKFK